MSDITTIVTNLASVVSTALGATYGRIANPYLPEENDQLVLSKGYGIAVGPGRDAQLYQGCRTSYERQFSVLLFNVLTAMASDATNRSAQDAALLEDFRLVRRALEQNQTLSGVAIRVNYAGDTGLVLSVGEAGKYLSIGIDFAILYEEAL